MSLRHGEKNLTHLNSQSPRIECCGQGSVHVLAGGMVGAGFRFRGLEKPTAICDCEGSNGERIGTIPLCDMI